MTPSLRPQRNVRLPRRYEVYDLNFVEVDIPNNYKEAVSCEESSNWKAAINEELQALKENNTWTETELPPGKKAIGSRWVFKVKRNEDGSISKYKARLCAKGYAQQKDIDYGEIFSPTTRYDSIRVILATAAVRHQNSISLWRLGRRNLHDFTRGYED